jgi:hypothetical protein
MQSRRPSRIARIALWTCFASLLTLESCSVATQDNFTNPPPGPPRTCTQVPALWGCAEGSLSYSCTSDRPDDGDTNLVCDDGTPGVGFEGGIPTLFCCAPYGQWASECTPATAVPGCGAESLGFSCSGEASPDQVDTSLVCSRAIPSSGDASEYCCISFNQASGACRCASFDAETGACGGQAVSGCSGATIAFTCASGHSPTEVNPLLACGMPEGGSESAYCCQTP